MSTESALSAGAADAAKTEPVARPFGFVRDRGERATGINALFNRFTGRRRSLREYQWEFYECLPPGAHVWAIVDNASEEVVGHHGIVPTPMVVRGEQVSGGRTENTIIEPSVRKKIFYPGMEKRAFGEAIKDFALLYTVHASGPQGRIRERLGYRPVGRWSVYLPVIGRRYLVVLLGRLRDRLARQLPDFLVALAASVAASLLRCVALFQRPPRRTTCEVVDDLDALRPEYEELWAAARGTYDVSIDRTWDFLRWRILDNPNLQFRLWALRRDGRLEGIVIGHRHVLGEAWALYIDDLIVRRYDEADFVELVRWLPFLEPNADAVVLMTLANGTPLHRALERRYPVQSLLLRRLGQRVFDEVVAYDRDDRCANERWYVTPLFTEGLDTSRPGL